MTDLPNPGQVYASSYANTGPMNMQPTGTAGDMSQFITHPAQIGTVPLYRVTLPQPTMGSGPIPMCQPGQSGPALSHTVTMVPNPGPMAPAGQIRFAGQMIQQVVQSQNSTSLGFKCLLTEMRARQFDAIRFAAYRTASKLRYIQQRTLFGMVDLWRVVDTFRDFGLHQITENNATLDYASTSRLLARIYSHLNGALDPNSGKPPRTLDVNAIHKAVDLLLGWLAYALDICATGRLTVTGLKIALSVLTNAKPAEKFRYHFTLLSDPSGALIPAKFEAYLQDLLKLPVSVFEGPNFFYTPQAAQALLSGRSKNILIEEFLDRMLADPGSQLLVWLTIFHRLAAVENVRHNVRCEVCKREPMWGLRYKCTRCPHYNLCQDCFWTGATTDQHTNAHDVKEYSSSSKSHSRQFGHSLRKSFHLSRLTGSTTQSGSAGSTDSASLVTTGSQRHSGTGQVFKRAPLGSIFEWNSAPGSVDANGFTKNGSVMSPPGTNTSIDAGAGQLNYRPQMPVSAVRSPLPHRRLQQLNPLFLSAPTNPTVQQFPNSNVMMTQSPIYAPGQLTSVPAYPSEQPAVRLTNPSSNPMVPMGYNPIKARPPNTLDGERHANLMSPAGGMDPRQILLNSAVPQPIMNSPGYMMSAPMYRQTTDSLSSTTPSEPWSTSVTTTNSMVPSSNQPAEQRQTFQSNMVNSTSSAIRNADIKCREEHRLIARYAAQLAAASAFTAEFEKFGDVADSPHTQKQLIAELQAKNRKILKEIERLRVEQQKQAAIIAAARSDGTSGVKGDGSKELDSLHDCALSPNTLAQLNRSEGQSTGSGGASGAAGVGAGSGGAGGCGGGTGGGSSTSSGENPKLVTELHALRQRKDELEMRMSNLQRNRTELMLQLETLVRLLSMTGGPIQTSRPRQQSLDMTDSIIPDLSPAGLLPSTPSLSGRFHHQSRLGSKPPENPPRRSSSLCQTSTDRSALDRERFGTRTGEDSKVSERKLSSNTPLDGRSGLSKYTDSSLLRAELIRKSLLSPTSDAHSDSSAVRYRSNDVTAVLTDKPSSTPSTTCDALLEKFEYLLKKTDSTQTASKRTLGAARSGSRQHSGLNSYGQTLHGNGHSGNHTDSGSEVYLYSDPEMGYSGSALSSARREAVNRTKPLLSRSRGEDVIKPRLGTTYSDNYEYAGMMQNDSSTVSSGIGANRSAETTASEVVAAPKQLTSGSEKERIV